MQRVQCGRGRRRDPGGIGAGLGVGNLLLQHGGHQVGHGPHPLADLRAPAQAGAQARQHVAALIRSKPAARFHIALADHGAGVHGGVHFISGAVVDPGVDEGNATARFVDARHQVDGRAALLVHDAELDGVAIQAQQLFDATEQFVGERDFCRAVHLGLDDIDRTGARIAVRVRIVAADIVQCDQCGDNGIDDALGDFVAVLVENGRVRHQVPHVTQEQHRAPVQPDRAAARVAVAGACGVDAILVERACDGLAVLDQGFGQRALEDAEPVLVGQHLVIGIDCGDRILEVENRRERSFEDHIGHAGSVVLADPFRAIDLHIDVQAVVGQENGAGRFWLALVADKLADVGQVRNGSVSQRDGQLPVLDRVLARIGVRAVSERHGVVEELAGEGNDFGATQGVVRLAVRRGFGRAIGFRNRIRAIERIVERTPARVGGVQRIACVEHRHDQLRAGLQRELGVDIVGGRFHAGRLGDKVSDRRQELAVARHIPDRTGMRAMPGIHFGLETIALGQQGRVFRRQIVDDFIKTLPEGCAVDASARQYVVFDKPVENRGDLKAIADGAGSHA